MAILQIIILFTGLALFSSCSDDVAKVAAVSTSDPTGDDITDTEFTNRDADCAEYVGEYYSEIEDEGLGTDFTGTVEISSNSTECTISSNSIPNHDVNDGNSFATNIGTVDAEYTISRSPSDASSITELSLSYDNAVFLNGAKLDLLPAACYGVGNEPLGQEKIGCSDNDSPWRYDPMYSGNNFGTDSHNAHTQPDGTYHYHGNPLAMFDTSCNSESPLVGWAADGYPIYGPCIEDGNSFREVDSSYSLKSGSRVSQSGEGAFPGGTYDGTFRDDYQYVASSGDLDECNGMTRDSKYGYYITNEFPWVMNCFKGTLNSSFSKGN